MEGHVAVAAGGDLVDIEKPGFAVVEAQPLGRFAGQQIVGAFDVCGGKGLSVMPFDALAQLEVQFVAILAPTPTRADVGDERLLSGLSHAPFYKAKLL